MNEVPFIYCPKCGNQISETKRFCHNCGTRMDLVVELITEEGKSVKSVRQKVMGVTLVITAGFLALLYLIIFGTVTLPHIKSTSRFLWIWLSFVIISISIGSIGMVNLLRSGFFSELKRQDLKIQLEKIEKKRRDESVKVEGAARTQSLPDSAEPPSITEATTRELKREATKDTKDTQDKKVKK
jgi:zinc-ribbon domain